MKRISLALLALCVMASMVFATSPHFVTGPNATLQTTGNLTVSWKEAGLGDNVTIHYTSSAQATAVYACINGGGKHAQATNKETATAPVTCSGDFSSGKNGNIIASLTCPLPGAGDFSCPSGQTLTLTSVSYSGISLTDNTNNIVEDAAPSALSACLISGPVLDRDPQLCPQP